MSKRLLDILAYGMALSITRVVIVCLSPVLVIFATEATSARWSVAISLSSLFAAILGMGLSTAVVRWYYDAPEAQRSQMFGAFVSLRLKSFAVVSGLSALAAWLAWAPLTGQVVALWPYLPMLILFGLGEALARFLASTLRLHNEPWRLAILRSGHALGSGLVTVVAVMFSETEPFVAFSVAYFVLAVPMVWIIAYYAEPPSSEYQTEIPKVLRFALPLTLHDLGWWLRGTALVLVVANYEDAVTVSAFFLAMLALMPFGVLYSSIDQTLAADYYRARAADQSPVGARRGYRIAVFGSACIATVCMVLTKPVADTFFEDQATVIKQVSPIVLFGITCHGAYIVWVKSLIYLKRTGLLLAGTVSISSIGVALAMILGAEIGYIAVAWASAGMFAATALFVLTVVLVLKDEPLDFLGPLTSVGLSGAVLLLILLGVV